MSGVKVVVLCEDQQTKRFMYTFLKLRGFRPHQIRIRLPELDKLRRRPGFRNHQIHTRPAEVRRGDEEKPLMGGAGEQWVRTQYPNELKEIRDNKNAYLIVVIDADGGTIDKRHKDLEKACEAGNILPRNKSDRNVLHIIPRRNIETWLAYLDGKNIDETTDYKQNCKKLCPKNCARHLYDMCHDDQRLRKPTPDSLQRACKEYKKLQR